MNESYPFRLVPVLSHLVLVQCIVLIAIESKM